MKLKLDENLSIKLKEALNAQNHDVLTAADEGLLSQSDLKVAAASREEGRMLLTLDLEFGDLRKHPPGRHPGIILFRPRSYGPFSVNRFVEGFVRETDLSGFQGCVVLVEPHRVRVRRPPLDTSGREWQETSI